MRANHCGACREEIRHGVRDGVTGWWHRENVDHRAVLGTPITPEILEETRRQREDVIRYYEDGTPYTTAEHDIKKDPDAERRNRRLAALRGQDPDYVEPLPPPEIPVHDVSIDDLPPRSGIRQVANLVVRTEGWEIVSLHHVRGPYVGSKGDMLSMSDSHVLRARARQVDGTVKIAVISWRDFKFDFAFIGTKNDVRKADSTTMKNWIKGTE